MSRRYLTSSTVRRIAGAGLVTAAIGIPIQIVGGAGYPAVPPGLLILVAAAALILFVPGRWALGLAALVTLFISVGGIFAPNLRHQLGDPGETVAFVGSIVQVIGLVVALVFGVGAINEEFRGRAAPTLVGPNTSDGRQT